VIPQHGYLLATSAVLTSAAASSILINPGSSGFPESAQRLPNFAPILPSFPEPDNDQRTYRCPQHIHGVKKVLGHFLFLYLIIHACRIFCSQFISRDAGILVCSRLHGSLETNILVQQPRVITLVFALQAQIPEQVLFLV
jgi:hypothetical protein